MYCSLDFWIGNLSCRIVSIQSTTFLEQETLYYDHDHACPELHWIASGSCDYLCDKSRYHIQADQMIIIPPRMYHRETNVSQDFKKLCIQIDIRTGTEKLTAFDKRFRNALLCEEVTLLDVIGKELKDIRDRICVLTGQTEKDSLFLERLRVLCNYLFVELLATLPDDHAKQKGTQPIKGISPELLIDTHIAHQFMPGASVESLAKQLNVSQRQLQRIITQKYGTNYRNKIKEVRVEIATDFLCNTDKSIAQIAELMGYSTPSSFSNFMKKATGKSPTQIRKEGSHKKYMPSEGISSNLP